MEGVAVEECGERSRRRREWRVMDGGEEEVPNVNVNGELVRVEAAGVDGDG